MDFLPDSDFFCIIVTMMENKSEIGYPKLFFLISKYCSYAHNNQTICLCIKQNWYLSWGCKSTAKRLRGLKNKVRTIKESVKMINSSVLESLVVEVLDYQIKNELFWNFDHLAILMHLIQYTSIKALINGNEASRE